MDSFRENIMLELTLLLSINIFSVSIYHDTDWPSYIITVKFDKKLDNIVIYQLYPSYMYQDGILQSTHLNNHIIGRHARWIGVGKRNRSGIYQMVWSDTTNQQEQIFGQIYINRFHIDHVWTNSRDERI